jgi:predicted RNase H-like nuclease (RuvC/YqgF family)
MDVLKSVPRVVQTMLDELIVYCPRKSDGCSATVKRSQLEHHLKDECDIKHSTDNMQCRGTEENEITKLQKLVQNLQNELRDAKSCIASLEERLSSLTFYVDNSLQSREQETVMERLSHDVQVLLTEQGQTRNDLNLLFLF